ncbi:MAG TPA: hypothetical protein VFI87_11155 [Hyphomicrobiaceae bacterium]|nr:hypothetical protein [Hyphomicrobiaceae bacterium]
MKTIKKGAPILWMLVKVPQITNLETGGDCTVKDLRECVRSDHFGGEGAAVRKLSAKEIRALKFVGAASTKESA